jgi:hypothetical protein
MDGELKMKLESLVISALPELSKQSDFNMLYLANIDIEVEDGVRKQISIESDDSVFLSISNDFGYLDWDMIKTIHVPGVISSDFEVMSYTPLPENIHMFATYYEGREVPVGGGYMHVAICPFGVNKIELLNGDVIQIFGTGRIPISAAQRGFKRYSEIPKVDKILSNDYFKILKIAIYTRYRQYQHRKYSLNVFSPSMKVVKEEIVGQIPLTSQKLLAYSNTNTETDNNNNILLVDEKNGVRFPISFSQGDPSNLYGIGKMLAITKDDYIDLSAIGPQMGDEFTIHLNLTISNYANRGTVLCELGYGVTSVGFQTHHITLWLDKHGELRFNGQYSDEHLGTGCFLKKHIEHSISLTLENQKFDETDDNEYMFFIHVNGKQVWPSKSMLTPTEKIYLWRAKEAYRTLTEVCAMLPAPHPVSGGLDAQGVCAKKLLQESGFITTEKLKDVYTMYLQRPRASKADVGEIELNSTDNTTLKKFFVGQDSEKDVFDNEYYFDGQISEIGIFSPPLNREEIELAHLLNIIRSTSVKV